MRIRANNPLGTLGFFGYLIVNLVNVLLNSIGSFFKS